MLFGFAFLCKPSEFLVTGFEITAAVLFSYAGFLRESPIASRQAASLILKSFGFFLLGAAIVFGPYLLDQGAEIFAYMYTALFTLGDVNAFHADRSAQFAYYLWNPAAGFVALGFWLWIGLAAMLTRLALTFGKARKADRKSTRLNSSH